MSKRQQTSLFISFESLVTENHPYRKLNDIISFEELSRPYQDIYSTKGRKEKVVEFGLRERLGT
jgi:hypothetical protein